MRHIVGWEGNGDMILKREVSGYSLGGEGGCERGWGCWAEGKENSRSQTQADGPRHTAYETQSRPGAGAGAGGGGQSRDQADTNTDKHCRCCWCSR